ncbi:MAG: hypothetical protein GXO50_07360 [Chlorobi bacterium]|nr:hypothetical protein [Chlorobiota bacterium]
MPKVHKNVLILIAGILWTGVGILLNFFASRWIPVLSSGELIFGIILGIAGGAAIAYFGFGKLADKNIMRIDAYEGKVCMWAFQKWQSYILIIFMISLGIFMRTSGLVPKIILTPMYIAIGLALFISSFRYYLFLFKQKK